MLTGQYLHNLPITNNSVSGGCASQEWQDGPEQNTFATYLKSQVKLDSGIEIGTGIKNKFRFLTSGIHNILRRQVSKSVWCGTVTRWHWACPTRMGWVERPQGELQVLQLHTLYQWRGRKAWGWLWEWLSHGCYWEKSSGISWQFGRWSLFSFTWSQATLFVILTISKQIRHRSWWCWALLQHIFHSPQPLSIWMSSMMRRHHELQVS